MDAHRPSGNLNSYDVRQAVYATNEREKKNAKYKSVGIKKWFDEQAAAGRLEVVQSSTTWRSNQVIAAFADSIFDGSWKFTPTESENDVTTGHDGLFIVHPSHVPAYVDRFRPLCLRHAANSGEGLQLPYVNFRMAKGLSADRVLIYPTAVIAQFLRSGKALEARAACSLYVAVTRARFSVAFVSERGAELGLAAWAP